MTKEEIDRFLAPMRDPKVQKLLSELGPEFLKSKPWHLGPPVAGLAEAVRKAREAVKR